MTKHKQWRRQGRIKGGGTLGKCQGPRAFGGPADFLGLAVVYGPMFFGTAPHGFGRTYIFIPKFSNAWCDIKFLN